MKKILAFTLAETLIVMGIIGIVSALTLPNLNSSTGEKEKIVKVKKIYQNLNDALGRAQAVYGPFEEWFINDTTQNAKAKRFGDRITEFMKVSKNCGTETNKGCFSAQNILNVKLTNLATSHDISDTAYKIITADGTSISFLAGLWEFYVDIDGPNKGKNALGHDIYAYKFEGRPSVINTIYISSPFSTILSDVKNSGYSCSTWIINYDNMDYLKCPDKLSENQTSCK